MNDTPTEPPTEPNPEISPERVQEILFANQTIDEMVDVVIRLIGTSVDYLPQSRFRIVFINRLIARLQEKSSEMTRGVR